ncbi:Helicase associated domain HA2 containing protein, related [Eimeria praecox]|uniref:RNA helicase n=1 Tax=Eimeria praecox TaxID=51316 RepID=U6G2H7_9EIME|nr:Helicase associated domain HA2 containing protein, related [Eimeria praecox]
MSYNEVSSWLREELQRRVGAATRSLVAAVQAAAEESPTSHQLSERLQQELHFSQQDADALAPELFRRMAAAEAAATAAAAAAAAAEAATEEAARESRKRPREEETNGQNEETSDAAEAAAFAARLRARDAASQKKVGAAAERQQQLEREAEEAAEEPVKELRTVEDVLLEAKKRPNEKLKDNEAYMQRLREEARRAYLKKREGDQVLLQERKVQDREWLYSQVGDKLTAEERRALELRKETLQLAKTAIQERQGREEIEGYIMPEAYDEDLQARLRVMHQPYQEPKQQLSEQQLLEKQKTQAALVRFGAKEGREKAPAYKLVDETGAAIEFEAREMHGSLTPEADASAQKPAQAPEAAQKAKGQSLQEQRRLLPVYAYREEFLRAVAKYPVLVVVGETGSGKTTQLPQFLREVGYAKAGMVGCTQPRRIAAMSVAARVAQEVGCRLGLEVGYSIRFEDCTSDKTELKYMTDGMLLREFLTEPDLQSYSALMIDEAHERTLHTDVLFALVKDLSRYREDFRLIISSATLEAEKFSVYFDDAPIFRIPGRRFPVQIYYTKSPEANFLDAAVVTALQLHFTQPPGDILLFLPGQQEIDEAVEEIQRRLKGRGTEAAELIVLPLYSSLPGDQQARVFEPTPPGARKAVFATNIAETSITLEGVVYVVDCGFCRENQYSAKTGMDALVTVPCSKAAANQRSGRAGRVRAGHCFRLYTRYSFEKEMEDANVPEIQRANLSHVVLTLKGLGIDDLLKFDFMDPPSPDALISALELLYALAALNDQGELTKLGRRMAEFPLDPMFSKFIVNSEKYGCVSEALTVCAMLGVGNMLFYRPKDKAIHADNARKTFAKPGGDPLTLLNVYDQWLDTGYSVAWCYENFVQHRSMQRARDVREQLQGLLERVELEEKSCEGADEPIRKAITSGFFTQAARLNRHGSFTTLKHPHTVEIHPHSSLFGQYPRFVVYTELALTTKEYMRSVCEVKPEWLAEVAPHFYKQQDLQVGKMPKALGRAKQEDTPLGAAT